MFWNCMYGFIVDEVMGGGKNGMRLCIFYEKRVKVYSIWNWIQNYFCIVIFIVVVFFVGIFVVIFDLIC